jgi:hypothetical protein
MKPRSWLHRSFHLHEQQRLERESAERVHLALHARSLKAKLSPLVGVIVALVGGVFARADLASRDTTRK